MRVPWKILAIESLLTEQVKIKDMENISGKILAASYAS